MGMAASQARLLTITARLADNELRSQTINNAKMRLATQSSQASQNYINALNNATLKFSNYDSAGNAQIQDLSYNALTAYSSYNTQYGLINSAGQILVSEDEAAIFASAEGNLDAYLKKHGLEYTTTYFDQLGAFENPTYPEPFKNISVEDMKKYYEGYGSYQNSKEVEDYEKSYKDYVISSNNLIKATETSFESYLKYSGNTPKIQYNEQKEFEISSITEANSLSDALKAFQNAFLDENGTNTFNVKKLINKNLLPDTVETAVAARLNQFSVVTNAIGEEMIKYTANTTLTKTELDGGGYEYVTDDGIKITVDKDGNVTGYNCEEAQDYAKDVELLNGIKIEDKVPFETFMNNFAYKPIKDNGTVQYFYYNYSEETGLTTTTYSSDLNEVKAQLNSIAEDIVYLINKSANFENFSELLLSKDFKPEQYGIDVTSEIPGLNKTLETVLKEYNDSKSTFMNNIFSSDSIKQVDQHIKENFTFETGELDEDGKPIKYVVTVENLTDVDFVLKYLDAVEKLPEDLEKPKIKIKQSESFNTVIKEYLIDNMIEVYGEPKYAWVDENDTSNKGNADAKAQWYTNLFNRMKQGYKAIENGLASSSEWLTYALENGIVSLEQVDKSFKWNGLSYKTCTKITEETDTEATTKAEAEYNRAMNDIKAKDNIYDMQLKNIDTEHSSLLAEYDVIKGVIDKNVQRTFKFNQSA